MSIHQEPLPILKPMDLLLALWVVSPYFLLFTHKTVYPINILNLLNIHLNSSLSVYLINLKI